VSKRKPAVRPRAGIGGSDGIDDGEPLFRIARLLHEKEGLIEDEAIRLAIGKPHADDKDKDFRRLSGKIERKDPPHPQWVAAQERAARTPRDVPRTHHLNITIAPLCQSFDPPQMIEGDLPSAKTKDLVKRHGRRIR
jgi:hypothetical protein